MVLVLLERHARIDQTHAFRAIGREIARFDSVIARQVLDPADKLIEIRGLGIRHCDFAKEAIVGLVVDLSAPDAARLPEPEALRTRICGVEIPRIPVVAGYAALPLVLAALIMAESSTFAQPRARLLEGNW